MPQDLCTGLSRSTGRVEQRYRTSISRAIGTPFGLKWTRTEPHDSIISQLTMSRSLCCATIVVIACTFDQSHSTHRVSNGPVFPIVVSPPPPGGQRPPQLSSWLKPCWKPHALNTTRSLDRVHCDTPTPTLSFASFVFPSRSKPRPKQGATGQVSERDMNNWATEKKVLTLPLLV